MAGKVSVNGEVFEWDPFGERLLSEALFVERVTRCSYTVWEEELPQKMKEGSAESLAVLLAITLRRAGHEISVEDARAGTFEIAGRQVDLLRLEFTPGSKEEEEVGAPDPTIAAGVPEASATT